MSNFGIIALVQSHQPEALKNPSIAIAAARAGAVGVVDLEHACDLHAASVAVKVVARYGRGPCGIRCGVDQLEEAEPALGALAEFGAAGTGIVILSAGKESLSDDCLGKAIARIAGLGLKSFVEAISVDEAVRAQLAGADAVIAKGHEGAGRVGDETAFVLTQRFTRALSLPVYVQGGIGLHTAAASFAAGAAGCVLDSQLLLTRESYLSEEERGRLSRLDGTECVAVGQELGESFRLWGRAGNARLEALTDAVQNLCRSWQDSEKGRDEVLLELRRLASQAVREANQGADAGERLFILGQDVAFAPALARRHRTVAGVIQAIIASVETSIRQAAEFTPLSPGSPLAASHGCQFPVVQGAMTRVSDTAEFAFAVADKGALPFLALALMRKEELEGLLAATAKKLAGLPWGVGILGFTPEQLRKEQFAVIERFKPPYALIAGGRPDQAQSLEKIGVKTYLHVPSPYLLTSFIEIGSRRFIFEGKECGGHVGPRSSFVLWECMIDTLLAAIGPKEDASAYHIVFAGGIHDDLSAAMVAALAAPLAARGVRVGVLMGTAYLFTREAVATGAVVEKFQEAALSCERTVLFETGPGHSIRCIESPYRQDFDQARRQLEGAGRTRNQVREELELMNLGRLRIASKGLARASAGGLTKVDTHEQWRQGMYMIGQVASMHDSPTTIGELHANVCQGATKIIASLARDSAPAPERQPGRDPEGIAIVGMSCLFPKANNLQEFWENILAKVDAITEVPAEHWDWRKYYDRDPLARDKISSKWGGFLKDVPFDPTRYGIPPSSLPSIDPMQLLILETTRAALADAGYGERSFSREKTSVVLANAGHGPITALYSLRSMIDWYLADMDPGYRKELESRLPEWTEDTFPGYLGNVTAGRVANRFDLGGINFSVDAACASSLAALYVAMKDLRSRASDMVLLTATDTHNQPGDYLSFSKVHALSPQGRCRTFDATADGIVISEGVATLVLKRVSDAERDGDRIYAVIKGIGGSSDGRDLSLTAPRPGGQVQALTRAYEDAGISPATIALVEAHGTGTVAGDKAEVEALRQVYEGSGATRQSCAIGSVKTMIGHTKAAAGLASLIKVAKSLYHNVLPPTIGVTAPNPACNFEASPFYINSETRPWLAAGEAPRRAGVSAFGFGGTNFHAVLEEYRQPVGDRREPASTRWPTELFLVRAGSREALTRSLSGLADLLKRANSDARVLEGPCEEDQRARLSDLASAWHAYANQSGWHRATFCLSIVADSFDDLKAKLERARQALSDPATQEINDPRGVYFTDMPLAGSGKVAFLFPGQGSQRLDMLKELALNFALVREPFELADRLLAERLEKPLSRYVFPTPQFNGVKDNEDRLTDTHVAQPAMGAADLAVLSLLKALGVKAEMVAGHSYGEYVALCAAGAMTREELLDVSEKRGRMLSTESGSPDGAMAAVTASADDVRRLIGNLSDITLANVNAPRQCILAGGRQSIEKAVAVISAQNVPAKVIPVSAAFHSPHMEPARGRLSHVLSALSVAAPALPVYSNVDAATYGQTKGEIVNRLADHLVNPVRFLDQIESMHEAGARLFVEVGPGTVLTGLVSAILDGKPHLAVSVDRPGRHGITQLQHALAVLASQGVPVNLEALVTGRGRQVPASEPEGKDEAGPSASGKKLSYVANSARVERAGAKPASARAQTQVLASAAKPSATGSVCVKEPERTNGNEKDKEGKREALRMQRAKQEESPAAKPVRREDTSTKRATPAHSADRSGREAVMLEFQRTMLEMTQNFLDAQQNVMLAYLRGQAPDAPLEAAFTAPVRASLDEVAKAFVPAASIPESHPAAKEKNGHHLPEAEQKDNGQLLDAPAPSPSHAGIVASESIGPPELRADELAQALVDIVSERTGYPSEMLDPKLDLEADLGIDSIKRVEILNSFRKLLPESKQQQLEGGLEKLAGTKTLAGIIEWIKSDLVHQENEDRTAEPAAATTQPSAQPLKRTADAESQPVSAGVVARGLVRRVEAPYQAGEPLRLRGGIVIIDDGQGTGENLAGILRARSQPAVIVRHSEDSHGRKPTDFYEANLTDADSVKAVLDKIRREKGPIGALAHIVGAAAQKGDSDPELLATRSLFLLVKELQHELSAAEKDMAVVTATRLGGDFAAGGTVAEGFDPRQAALPGMMKTIAREFPGARVRAVDFAGDEQAFAMADKLADELFCECDEVEIGYIDGLRYRLSVVPQEIADASMAGDPAGLVDASSVVLVTGGARGITAEICLEMARRARPTFVIVGRLPRPEGPEPADTARHEGPREIKAAIIERLRADGQTISVPAVEFIFQKLMREREIRRNLEAIEACGSKVHYHALDVRDDNAFAALIDRIYDTCGSIDGVIHGAGVIEDGYIRDKSLESFSRVYATKVASAMTLSRKVELKSLKFLFFFSSVVGRTGNAGQCDYVAANEVLNKLAISLNKLTEARVASIMWGPWRGGMAAPELESIFARQGWSMIEPAQGRQSFWQELALGGNGDAEVLLVGQLNRKQNVDPQGEPAPAGNLPNGVVARGPRLSGCPSASPREGENEFRVDIDIERDLYLEDHKFDGVPVMPMAVALELMSEAAQSVYPDWHLVSVRELGIPSGIVFESGAKTLVVSAEKISEAADAARLKVSVAVDGATRRVCFQAVAELAPLAPPAPQLPSLPASYSEPQVGERVAIPPSAGAIYRNWLFHGPIFQGIESVDVMGQTGIVGTVTGRSPRECLRTTTEESWLIDPVLVDSSMQLAGVWTRNYMDITVLPTGFAAMHLAAEKTPGKYRALVVIPPETRGNELRCDLGVYDSDGRLVLAIEGLGGIGSKSLNRLSTRGKELGAAR